MAISSRRVQTGYPPTDPPAEQRCHVKRRKMPPPISCGGRVWSYPELNSPTAPAFSLSDSMPEPPRLPSLTPPLPAKRKRHPRCPPLKPSSPPQQAPLLQGCNPLQGTPTTLPVLPAPRQRRRSCTTIECPERGRLLSAPLVTCVSLFPFAFLALAPAMELTMHPFGA
jgi:hypothetical protein